MTESQATSEIRQYWEGASCGTTVTSQPKFSKEYFEEVERFRYAVEPFIHGFAQFTRWSGKDMLEVGVGAGTDFVQFVRAGARAHGVDLTDEAIQNVRHRLDVYGLSATDLRRCNAEHLPYPDGKFDLVYSWGVIHHAEHTWQVFSEIYRVTKPGGTIKLMLYNRASLYTWYLALRYAVPRGHIRNARDWALYHHQESVATKGYTEADIRHQLESFPHRDLRFHYFDQYVRPGARFGRVRSVVERFCPDRLRWYMAFELQKTE